jgi:hypothetical protein
MEVEILKSVAQIAGIGGIALGVLLLLFRDIVRKQIFPTFDRERGYRLLRLISLLTWSIALVGIGAWVWMESELRGSSINISADRSVVGGRDITGNITINAPETDQAPMPEVDE